MVERVIWVVLLVAGASGGFYAGRQNGIKIGQTQVQQVSSRFFTDRGGNGAAAGGTGATGVGGNGTGGNGGAGGAGGQGTRQRTGQGQNLVGTVDSIDGMTLMVKARDNTTSKVQLNADATISKTVTGQASDIHVGDQVVANGTRTGDVFLATRIQLGVQFGRPQTAGQ